MFKVSLWCIVKTKFLNFKTKNLSCYLLQSEVYFRRWKLKLKNFYILSNSNPENIYLIKTKFIIWNKTIFLALNERNSQTLGKIGAVDNFSSPPLFWRQSCNPVSYLAVQIPTLMLSQSPTRIPSYSPVLSNIINSPYA